MHRTQIHQKWDLKGDIPSIYCCNVYKVKLKKLLIHLRVNPRIFHISLYLLGSGQQLYHTTIPQATIEKATPKPNPQHKQQSPSLQVDHKFSKPIIQSATNAQLQKK